MGRKIPTYLPRRDRACEFLIEPISTHSKVQAIKSVKVPHTIYYPVKIRQTLVRAEPVKAKSPK